MHYKKRIATIFICLCLMTSCTSKVETNISSVPMSANITVTETPNIEIISDNNTVLEVGSVITEIKYATRAYYLRDKNIKKEKADEMKMLLSNISLYVQDIDESFLYLNLETKFANAVYKIPHNGHMALSDYFIYYDNQIDEYGSYDYLASRVSVKDKNNSNELYELGDVFIDYPNDRSKVYDMDCFFIPSDKYRMDTSEIIEYSLLGYGSNEQNKLKAASEIYAKLCFPENDNHCIVWEYYFGSDSEGNPCYMYADAEKESMEYDIDENCEIFYLEPDGYKKISLTELRSYNLSFWSSNIYLLGITDGKIVYMINMFVS